MRKLTKFELEPIKKVLEEYREKLKKQTENGDIDDKLILEIKKMKEIIKENETSDIK